MTHEAPDGGAASMAQVLDARVREGELVEKLDGGAVRCFACGHRCLVKPGRRGICKVRFNRDGTLYVPVGYVAALQCDPTEKKPFFHVLPGSDTLTFGMLGCDFHCGYCQNWLTSQALRDDAAGVLPTDVTPDRLVRLALRQGAKMVGSSYNEPLITAEWAVDVFKVAKTHGLKTAFISNGNATPEVLDYIRPWTDCYKIDLKAMDDKRYRELGGVLLVTVKVWVNGVGEPNGCVNTNGFGDAEAVAPDVTTTVIGTVTGELATVPDGPVAVMLMLLV